MKAKEALKEVKNYNILLYYELIFFMSKGYIKGVRLTYAGKFPIIKFYLNYVRPCEKDKEKMSNGNNWIGCVRIMLAPNPKEAGTTAFKGRGKFKAFKNGRSPYCLDLIVGQYTCKGSYHCTIEDVFPVVWMNYWGRTSDLYANVTNKANSLNGRYGNSFEKLLALNLEFMAKSQKSFLGEWAKCILALHKTGSWVIYDDLLTKEHTEFHAPVKTDTAFECDDGTMIKITAKCIHSASGLRSISLLGIGASTASSVATYLLLSHKHEGAYKTLTRLNEERRFKSLRTLKKRLPKKEYDTLEAGFKEIYPKMVKLAALGKNSLYSQSSLSEANYIVAFCLETHESFCCTADEFVEKVDRMPLEELMKCFPLGATSKGTLQVRFNARRFNKFQ